MLWVVLMLTWDLLMVGMLLLLLPPTKLVKWADILRAIVLRVLDMRSVDAFLRMALGLRSVVDIRIVPFVAGLIARHAWIPPQRAALAGRRGQSYYVLDHCWVALCFQKARGFCVAWLFLAMRLCAFRNLGIYAPI